MPCRYDPSPDEERMAAQAQANSYKRKLDKLTAENDTLREAVVSLSENRSFELPANVMKLIKDDQVKHRKADLSRLGKTLKTKLKSKDNDDYSRERLYVHLGRVTVADPTKELEPQLGFSPDAY